MTRLSHLKTTAARLTRAACGSAIGAGMALALVAAAPAVGHAQAAPAQPAPAQSSQMQAAPAAAAPRAVPAAQGEGPALWVVRDADSTLYLFGTVHVLRPTTGWGSAKVDAAFEGADDVWFEISNPDDQAAILPLIQQYGVSPDRPLSSLLNAEELAELDAAARTIGASAAALDPLRPWMAGLTLSMAPLVKAGYDPASGVELVLKARAEAAGKPIHGFETADQQVRILAGLPEDSQLNFLRTTLRDFDEATEELDAMVDAWAEGDMEALRAAGIDEMKAEAPEVYAAVLTRRNAAWAAQIQDILAGSGVAFIAVGAAHLAGEDSVQEQLAERGIVSTRQ